MLVNMHDAVPTSDINTTDATHPNDAGYEIMAKVWYQGLVNASSMISAPNAGGKEAPVSSSGTGRVMVWQVPWVIAVLVVWLMCS